jgi:hypothetical protein
MPVFSVEDYVYRQDYMDSFADHIISSLGVDPNEVKMKNRQFTMREVRNYIRLDFEYTFPSKYYNQYYFREYPSRITDWNGLVLRYWNGLRNESSQIINSEMSLPNSSFFCPKVVMERWFKTKDKFKKDIEKNVQEGLYLPRHMPEFGGGFQRKLPWEGP